MLNSGIRKCSIDPRDAPELKKRIPGEGGDLNKEVKKKKPQISSRKEENATTYRLGNDRDSDYSIIQDKSDDNGGFLKPDSPEEWDTQSMRSFKELIREKNTLIVENNDSQLYPEMNIDFNDHGATVDSMCIFMKC